MGVGDFKALFVIGNHLVNPIIVDLSAIVVLEVSEELVEGRSDEGNGLLFSQPVRDPSLLLFHLQVFLPIIFHLSFIVRSLPVSPHLVCKLFLVLWAFFRELSHGVWHSSSPVVSPVVSFFLIQEPIDSSSLSLIKFLLFFIVKASLLIPIELWNSLVILLHMVHKVVSWFLRVILLLFLVMAISSVLYCFILWELIIIYLV